MDNAENYEANKPLLDMMEQEFFRVTDAGSEYTRRSRAIDDIRTSIDPTGAFGTVAEEAFIKFFASEADKILLKQTIITNRLNALREGMKAIAKGKQPENANVKKVIKEFRQKLDGRDQALQAQIDNATAGWTQRRLDAIDDAQWRAHERYDGTQSLRSYADYLTGQAQKQYTRQLNTTYGVDDALDEDVAEGRLRSLDHFVETREGSITGLTLNRMGSNMQVLASITGKNAEQAKSMMRKMATGETGEGGSEEKDRITEEGLREYKSTMYQYLKKLEVKYGKMLTQLHPEDVLRKINIHEFGMEAKPIQDMVNLIDDNKTGIQLFDDNNPADVDYKALATYYFRAITAINMYVQSHVAGRPNQDMLEFQISSLTKQMDDARQAEDGVHEGPSLKSSQMPYYAQSVRQRYQNSSDPLGRQGFGRW